MVTFILSAIPLLISLFLAPKLPKLACFVLFYLTLESVFMLFMNTEALSYAAALAMTVLLFVINPVRNNADRLLIPSSIASSVCFLPFGNALFLLFLVLSVSASVFREKLMKYFIILFSSALLSLNLSRMYYLSHIVTLIIASVFIVLSLVLDPLRVHREK